MATCLGAAGPLPVLDLNPFDSAHMRDIVSHKSRMEPYGMGSHSDVEVFDSLSLSFEGSLNLPEGLAHIVRPWSAIHLTSQDTEIPREALPAFR